MREARIRPDRARSRSLPQRSRNLRQRSRTTNANANAVAVRIAVAVPIRVTVAVAIRVTIAVTVAIARPIGVAVAVSIAIAPVSGSVMGCPGAPDPSLPVARFQRRREPPMPAPPRRVTILRPERMPVRRYGISSCFISITVEAKAFVVMIRSYLDKDERAWTAGRKDRPAPTEGENWSCSSVRWQGPWRPKLPRGMTLLIADSHAGGSSEINARRRGTAGRVLVDFDILRPVGTYDVAAVNIIAVD